MPVRDVAEASHMQGSMSARCAPSPDGGGRDPTEATGWAMAFDELAVHIGGLAA